MTDQCNCYRRGLDCAHCDAQAKVGGSVHEWIVHIDACHAKSGGVENGTK